MASPSFFSEFIQHPFDRGSYINHLQMVLSQGISRRLLIDLTDLREFDSETTADIIQQPHNYIPQFEETLSAIVQDQGEVKQKLEYHVGFSGPFGDHHLSPRQLTSKFINHLISVEGVVTKCSLVRPKLVQSVSYSPVTEKTIKRNFRDGSDLSNDPTSAIIPSSDQEGNPLELEFGLSKYRDYQVLYLQEIPERAPPGQMPRSCCIILEDDLVDHAKPGDRIQIVGVFRPISRFGNMQFVSRFSFKTAILANNVVKLNQDYFSPDINAVDIAKIKALSKRKDIFELLSRSIAPSIWGHESIKQAILMLLLGGIERNLDSGTHLRGDINVLLIGDPGTAKSQILRFVLSLSPSSVSTTGRGASGVGLTAAVINDPETGGRKIEAGAMVLADRSVVCIDEFDKLSVVDRVAIHEVMEQQTVTIAKAGLHITLNARCSVLAAANPVWSRYNRAKTPQENIGLPHSLLSRFDLMFIVLDSQDAKRDVSISSHILRMHQSASENGIVGDPLFLRQNQETLLSTLQQQRDKTGEKKQTRIIRDKHQGELLSVGFLKLYIEYAKQVKPNLSDEAASAISKEYVLLRSHADGLLMPVTVRTLGTLIRLASAHAKLRLSSTVTIQDVTAIKKLLRFTLLCGGTQESASDDKIGFAIDFDTEDVADDSVFEGAFEDSDEDVDDIDDIDDDDDDDGSDGDRAPQPMDTSHDTPDVSVSLLPTATSSSAAASTVTMSSTRESNFLVRLMAAFELENTDELAQDHLLTLINRQNPRPFTQHEYKYMLKQLGDSNRIMVSAGRVYLIMQ